MANSTYPLTWDDTGKKLYEAGVKKGVLYVKTNGKYENGEAWNGLISVTESPSGAEPTPLYANDAKYLTLMSTEELGLTIEAYTYPESFAECDGSKELTPGVYIGQQARKTFGLCYRTSVGNDEDGVEYGYKLHLVYGALASPSEKAYTSINDSPEANTFSWEATTTPENATGFKPTSLITIDSKKVDADKLAALEAVLYGSGETPARLPLPDEVKTLLTAAA